jgi:hypothetical protein
MMSKKGQAIENQSDDGSARKLVDRISREALDQFSNTARSIAENPNLQDEEKVDTLCSALQGLTDLLVTDSAAPRLRPHFDEREGGHFLSSIDKLLNAAAELMKREPALDRQAFDHLRQLRTRLRFARQARPRIPSELPNVGEVIPKWRDRTNKLESPIDFIRREYSKLMEQGIPRVAIKGYDPPLYNVLCKWLSIHKTLPPDISLPTQRELNDLKLQAAGDIKKPSRSLKVADLTPEEAERLRLYEAARRRKKLGSSRH